MSNMRLRLLLEQLDGKISTLMTLRQQGMVLSDLYKQIADLLRQINKELPKEAREQQIALLSQPNQPPISIKDLPNLVEKGDERALKILQLLYAGR